MASTYPVTKDTFSVIHADNVGEVIHAQTTNDNSDAINHIESELGVLPSGPYADVTARLNQLELPPLNNQNVTSYTLVILDASRVVSMINGSASIVTVPPNSAVPFLIGTTVLIRQGPAAGAVTIAKGAGVTVNSRGGSLTLGGTVAYATLYKIATDQWDLFGDLV